MKKLHCCKFPYSCIFTDNDRFVNDKVEFKERVKKSIRECKQVVLEKSDDNDPHAIESVILHSPNFTLLFLPPFSPSPFSIPLLPLFPPSPFSIPLLPLFPPSPPLILSSLPPPSPSLPLLPLHPLSSPSPFSNASLPPPPLSLLPLFSPLIPLPPSLYSIGQWHHDVMKSARELIFEPEV